MTRCLLALLQDHLLYHVARGCNEELHVHHARTVQAVCIYIYVQNRHRWAGTNTNFRADVEAMHVGRTHCTSQTTLLAPSPGTLGVNSTLKLHEL